MVSLRQKCDFHKLNSFVLLLTKGDFIVLIAVMNGVIQYITFNNMYMQQHFRVSLNNIFAISIMSCRWPANLAKNRYSYINKTIIVIKMIEAYCRSSPHNFKRTASLTPFYKMRFFLLPIFYRIMDH